MLDLRRNGSIKLQTRELYLDNLEIIKLRMSSNHSSMDLLWKPMTKNVRIHKFGWRYGLDIESQILQVELSLA